MSAFQRLSGSNVDCAAAMDPTASSATTHTKRLIFMVPPPQRPRSETKEKYTTGADWPGAHPRAAVSQSNLHREMKGRTGIHSRRKCYWRVPHFPAFSEGCGF